MVNPSGLRADLEMVWAADTAVDPDAWTFERRSTGHCAVTALVVEGMYGGEILRATTSDGGSHYWNRLPDGSEVDLTGDQFDDNEEFGPVETRTRDYLLTNEATAWRFRLLWERLARLWWE